MTLAVLCSGQGPQRSNMFALTGDAPEAANLFAHAATLLGGRDPREMVQTDPDDTLHQNRVRQILCTLQALAATATLRGAWPRRLIIAGYSVGEVAAWSVAGLMDATMTLDLVSRRANAMDAPSRPGDAFVLGGPGAALDIIADVAKRMGAARAVRLAVNVASHTPRLAAASSEFRKILDQTPTKLAPDSNVRLFSGIDGSPVVNISAGLNKLAKQISHTVQWAHCLEGCVEAGASVFFELGPGRALNEMAAGAYPDISARSLEDFRTLQGARAWLARVVN